MESSLAGTRLLRYENCVFVGISLFWFQSMTSVELRILNGYYDVPDFVVGSIFDSPIISFLFRVHQRNVL